MKNHKKFYVAVFSFIFALNSVPSVIPQVSAETVSASGNAEEPDYNVTTINQLKSMQNFILNSSETSTLDAGYDLNGDGRIDSFDMCLMRKQYVEQQEKSSNFYSLSSELVKKTDEKYGMSVMSEDFCSNRLIVKVKKKCSFENYAPTDVISGPDNIYVLQFDSFEKMEKCKSALEQDNNIKYVELDAYMNCGESTSQSVTAEANSWGVSAIEADKYAEYLSSNVDSSVVVAVVDSGVSAHSFIGDRLLNTGYDLVDNDADPSDEDSHGTHVAGTVVDCTPGLNINIMPVRVLDENGDGSFLNAGNGIRYAAEKGADVINLSLGGRGGSKYVDESIEYAVELGVTVVASAGNSTSDTKYYCPAHLDNCIVVSACDSNNQKAGFSNYGESVDVTAPGVDILSSVPGEGYASFNGTSMSAPHISAAAAMIKYADPQATPAEIEQKIKEICLDLGEPGKDVYYGYGLPKLSNLIEDNPGIAPPSMEYTYLDDGTIELTKWTDIMSGTVTVPETFNGTKITSIGRFAFYNCDKITGIVLPDTITNIGTYAFSGCASLEEISIPDSVVNIQTNAFSSCSDLHKLKLSSALSSISDWAFAYCSSLSSVQIPETVTSVGNRAFMGSALTEIELPASVSEIKNKAFSDCDYLNKITILNSSCEIYDSADVIPETAVIVGYSGSTAQAYANKYNRNFIEY
ncbi:MAG: S8 family serine peptidase [Ruminococcus sp.]|nr:S8 family serine peptidase [Ruminococcus sp.]